MKTKILGLCGCLAVALASLAAPAQHTVTATLNYDFTSDNACSATVITGCLKQFNIYDLSGAAPVKLFSIAAPAGANVPITGITETNATHTIKCRSPAFLSSAQMYDYINTLPYACT